MVISSLLALTGPMRAQDKPSPDQSQGSDQAVSKIVPDAQIEADVLKAMAANPQLANQSISTTTVYGVVTLSGNVSDDATRQQADTVTSMVPGVKKVVDELAVGALDTGEIQQGANPDLNSGAPPPPGQQPSSAEPPQPASVPAVPNPDGPWAGDRPYPNESPTPPGYARRRPYSSPPPEDEVPDQNQGPQAPQQAGLTVIVPAGSLLRVRIDQGIGSQDVDAGARFHGVILNNVRTQGLIAIPRGATVDGVIVNATAAGRLGGRASVALQLTQLTLDGRTFPIETSTWSRQGESKTPQTVSSAVGFGVMGSLIGAAAGGPGGALLGAGVGGAAGLGASAASGGGQVLIPAEAIVSFHLTQQLQVVTMSQAEIDSLAAATPHVGSRSGFRSRSPATYLRDSGS